MKYSTYPRWSRREWMSCIAGCTLSRHINSAETAARPFRDYSKCVPEYLSSLAQSACERRARELSLLTDPAAIQKRQRWIRETFWQLVGGQPQRTPLNVQRPGTLDFDQFTIEKLIYQSRPGVVVSANLYIPKSGKPPYPGVLFQMGHSPLGKAYEPYQRCCQGLVQLGYVVLAFDPMGQGERIAYPDQSDQNTRLISVDEEHSVPGKQMILIGDSASRYQAWDAMRSLDLLASHPLVDQQRLASTGQSGGATLTMMLACVDDRLRAAVVCSGNTENVASLHFNPPGSTDDAEQNLIGSSQLGFDRWDLLYPMAPKPLLIQVSAHDFIGTYSPQYLENGSEEFQNLSAVYKLLGHPEHLAWGLSPLPHGLTLELRLATYNWFERWLKESPQQILEEPHAVIQSPRTLWAGKNGSVFSDFGSVRPSDLIKRAASAMATRTAPPHSWRDLLRVVSPAPDLKGRALASTRFEATRITAGEVNSAPSIWIPTWMFLPDQLDANRAALLILDDHGRNALAHEGGVYHRLARAGHIVWAADLRGIGDMRPEVGRGNPNYTIPHDSEEDYAWASLILGAPLLSQRVIDILSLVQAMRNEEAMAKRRIVLAARGRLTVPALFAFAAMAEIDALYLAAGLASFKALLETELYQQSLANFAWNLFRATDLPLLARQAQGRRIHLAGPVSGGDKPMPVSSVRAMYSSSNVSISDFAIWDERALASL
jgi:dienelactone hydrolase